jgi:hypothetical protein
MDYPTLQPDTKRGVYITWGSTIVATGLGFVLGGPYWGIALIAVGLVLGLRGHSPKLMESTTAQIAAGTFVLLVVLTCIALSPFGRSLWIKKPAPVTVRRFVDLTPEEAKQALQEIRVLRGKYRDEHGGAEPSREWQREELEKQMGVDIGPPLNAAGCPPGTGMMLNGARIGEMVGNSVGGLCASDSTIEKFNNNGALGPSKSK